MSKPHGYVWTSLKDGMETRFTNMYPNEFYKPFDIVPVYTHPVKELTDEETIKKLKAEISSLKRKVNHEYIRAELALANNKLTDKEITEIYFDDPDILVFARAILRKAQEK